ncbi:MAG: FRG domain-containing protein [Limisphaerales bacterium]
MSNPNPAPGGEAAVRCALNALLPGELSSGSFREAYEGHQAAGNPPAIRDAFRTAYERWGSPLEELYRVRARMEPGNGVHDDVFHLALSLALGCTGFVPRWAWLSADGLMPLLPEDLSLDLSFDELERAAKALKSDPWGGLGGSSHAKGDVSPGALEVSRTWFQGSTVRVFRGQRRGCPPWQMATSLDRLSASDARSRVAKETARVASGVARRWGIGFQHSLALAQHYSAELGLATRLLDVTVDPFIALYFAADPAPESDGEEGVVYRWSASELRDDPELLGALRLVMPAGEPRLLRQRGLFLAGPIAWALEQTWPLGWRFRQRRGLSFEDPDRGISKESLEPLSPWHDRLVAARDETVEPTAEDLGAVPGNPAEGRELLERCLFEHLQRQKKFPPPGRIELLARFHWAVTERLPPGHLARSLRLAKQTAEVIAARDVVPRDIPRTYHRQVELAEDTALLWEIWREILPEDRDWPR